MISTGYKELDSAIGGWQDGEFIVVGGCPGSGKTSFGVDCAIKAADTGKVLYMSLERPKRQLLKRIYTNLYGSDDCVDKLDVEKLESFCPQNLIIDDTPGITVDYFREVIKRHIDEDNLSLVIIDYVQLMREPEYFSVQHNRRKELSLIVNEIMATAAEFNVPIIVLSQMYRSTRGDTLPKIEDLCETAALSEVSDLILLLTEKLGIVARNIPGKKPCEIHWHFDDSHQKFVPTRAEDIELTFTDYMRAYLLAKCNHLMIDDVLENIPFRNSAHTNFWDVSEFLKGREDIAIELVDKVQIISIFIRKGGKIRMGSACYTIESLADLWTNLRELGYITEDEYQFLNVTFKTRSCYFPMAMEKEIHNIMPWLDEEENRGQDN